jgi:predicted nucleic acid-binding protein
MKIFDTSSIICILREIRFPKALDTCMKRGYRLTTTQQVFDEIKKNPDTFREFAAYGKFSVIAVNDDLCFKKFSKRFPWLHSGEISVLCLGLQKQREHARYICIIDERARTLKDKLQIRIHGTVGLLLWQKDRKELSSGECHDLYKRLLESSFRITEEILAGLIK